MEGQLGYIASIGPPQLDQQTLPQLEADRISFSSYFSAPENAFFIFRPKKTSAFSFLFFFRY